MYQLEFEYHPTIKELTNKYGYHIALFDLEDRAGYRILVTDMTLEETDEISYHDYHNMNQTNTKLLLENVCKRLLFRIEMSEIINT